MKISILHLSITVSLLGELSGQHLDVAGHTKIIGDFAVYHPMDCLSDLTGTKSGNRTPLEISCYHMTFVPFHVRKIIGNQNNSFFGTQTGMNSPGGRNFFIDFESGNFPTIGFQKSFFGNDTDVANGKGDANSFFENDASHDNQIGDVNSFYGSGSGYRNTGRNNNHNIYSYIPN